ncbi:MAG: heme-binding protein, partial [Pseudomonadota bacterium]
MSFTRQSQVLTHEGVLEMLRAAVAEAQSIGQPQCIVIVDGSGELLGEIRMTGAKYLSRKSARAKART